MTNSTGPRTAKGKARSSQNAAKHWIESTRILPPEQKEAAYLHQGLVKDFNPEGRIEYELVEDLVLNRLIRRRIDVAFTREFSRANCERRLRWIEDDEATAVEYRLRPFSPWQYPDKHHARLRPDLCIKALEELRDKIKERGLLPDSDLPTVHRIFGSEPTEDAALLARSLASIDDSKPGEPVDLEEHKEVALKILEEQICRQTERLEVGRTQGEIESASEIQEPDSPVLETLLRYRAANSREVKDLLDSLERVRRLRRPAA
jgi:hypothetical protein